MKYVVLLVLLISSHHVNGQIDIKPTMTGDLFGSDMLYYGDDTGELRLEDILTDRIQAKFQPSSEAAPKFGFTASTIWLKMELRNPSDTAKDIYIESRYPLLDKLILYDLSSEGAINMQAVGDRNPYSNRLVKNRLSVFKLIVPPGESTYYLSSETKGSMNLSLRFWTPPEFHINSKNEYFFIGLVFGFITVMGLYNLFLAISFMSKAYFSYVCYIVCFLFYQLGMTGLGMEIINGSSPTNFIQNSGLLIAIQGSNFFAILFASLFFSMRKRMPRTFHIFRFVNLLNALILISVAIFDYNIMAKTVNLITLTTALCLIINGVINIIKGYQPAIYFTLAWVVLLLGTIALALNVAGVVEVNFFTTWGLVLGGAIEVVLLSLALGSRVNHMRNKQENEITNLNEELKHHIEDIEDIVKEKTRDIKSIMTHIKQGIFTINADHKTGTSGIVGPDFSTHLSDIVDTNNIVGSEAVKSIFSKAILNEDTKNRIEEVLTASLGEEEINFFVNESNLAKEFRINDPKGRERTIEVDWSPVVDENESLVNKILVALKDVTEIRTLQAEANLQQEELEYIAEILNVDSTKFNKFIDICYKYIEESNRLIERSEEYNQEILKILYINMHTMKGMARSYGLLKLTDVLHKVEKFYAFLQKDSNQLWDKQQLQEDMDNVADMFNRYNELNIEKLNRGSEKNSISLKKSFLKQKITLLKRLDVSSLSKNDQQIISSTRESFEEIFYKNLHTLLTEMFAIVEPLARDLGKETPEVEIKNPGFMINEEGAEILQNVFTHIIRNSVDHGIEPKEIRLKKGKKPHGKITVKILEREGICEIFYEDDGAGLNLKRLREMGVQRGMLAEKDKDDPIAVGNLIFKDGLSTAPKVSEVSGRGVGMGAIQKFVEDSGGYLETVFTDRPDVNSNGISFGMMICLPMSFFNRR